MQPKGNFKGKGKGKSKLALFQEEVEAKCVQAQVADPPLTLPYSSDPEHTFWRGVGYAEGWRLAAETANESKSMDHGDDSELVDGCVEVPQPESPSCAVD